MRRGRPVSSRATRAVLGNVSRRWGRPAARAARRDSIRISWECLAAMTASEVASRPARGIRRAQTVLPVDLQALKDPKRVIIAEQDRCRATQQAWRAFPVTMVTYKTIRDRRTATSAVLGATRTRIARHATSAVLVTTPMALPSPHRDVNNALQAIMLTHLGRHRAMRVHLGTIKACPGRIAASSARKGAIRSRRARHRAMPTCSATSHWSGRALPPPLPQTGFARHSRRVPQLSTRPRHRPSVTTAHARP